MRTRRLLIELFKITSVDAVSVAAVCLPVCVRACFGVFAKCTILKLRFTACSFRVGIFNCLTGAPKSKPAYVHFIYFGHCFSAAQCAPSTTCGKNDRISF